MAEPTEKDPRGPTNLRIKFRSAGLDQFIERYAVDVSRGGIFIRTREPLSVGTRLNLEFQLLDAQPLLAGEGTVIWIREQDAARPNVTPGMAVRFDKLTPESQPTLEKILAEKARLQQAGGATGKSGGGLAVRRPSGVFSALDPQQQAAVKGASEVPTVERPAPALADRTPPMPGPSGPPPPPPAALAAAPKTGLLASRMAAGAGRARTSSGMSALRPAPVPSALFEPPTAADIDKALEALREESGPAPALPTPAAPTVERTPPGAVPSAVNSPTPSVPRYVVDDASNEPTRVVDVVEELVGGSTTARAPLPGSLAATAAEADVPAAPPAESAAAPPPPPPAAALDGPVDDAAAEPPDVKPAAPVAPVPAERSRRFRAASRAYPTLKKRRFTKTITGLAIVAAGALVAFKLHLKERLFHAPAPPPIVATAPTAPAPSPAAAATASPSQGLAQPQPAAPAAAAPAAAAQPEPKPPAAEAPNAHLAEASNKTTTDEAAAKDARKRGRRHAEATGSSGENAKPPEAAPAEKPAAEKPATDKPAAEKVVAEKSADKPVAEKAAAEKPAEDKAAAPSPAAAPAPPAPILKVSSTPAGAEVIIDGSSVGNTPYVSKDIDPSSPHEITIKKDGFETNERMISGLDWSRPRGNTPQSLKVNVKLRRSAPPPAAAPAAPKDKDNAEPDDTGGPYIKEVNPGSP